MNQPKVLILRGIPGAGKSHYATGQSSHLVFSADRFHTDDQGVYRYDPTKAQESHIDCFRRFMGATHDFWRRLAARHQEPPDYLIVDNTNIRGWEIAPYVQVANAHELEYEIITLWCDPIKAAQRNIHQVPAAVIFAKYADLLAEKLPAHWKHRVLLAE